MSVISVITSINPPNKCTTSIANSSFIDKLIVVADKKSPKIYNQSNCYYFDLESQNASEFNLKNKIPFNHYSRKNLGYLLAIKNGADIIYDTDDDNFLEKDNINIQELFETKNFIENNQNSQYCNIYNFFTNKFIWPRGLPIDEIRSNEKFKHKDLIQKCQIIQCLVNGDSDVDSIYRLVLNEHVEFKDRLSFCLDKSTFAPTNSQSTFFLKKIFPLLYLPKTVSFRFTDILRGIVLKRVLDLNNFKLGFKSPIAYQERNKHDYMKDFNSEISMFCNVKKANTVLLKIESSGSICEDLLNSYEKLCEVDIVKKEENIACNEWVSDLNKLGIKN